MLEDGLYSLMKANIPDFNGTDGNGNQEYQMSYLENFDPLPPPYCELERYKRVSEIDLSSNYQIFISSYTIKTYHNDSWALLGLQQRMRILLQNVPLTTVGGIYVQALKFLDDFHTTPPLLQVVRTRVYQGVLDFEITHNSI